MANHGDIPTNIDLAANQVAARNDADDGFNAYTLKYTHVQGTGAVVWNVNHGLGRRPSIQIFDTSGYEWKGEIRYIDDNNITITFGFAFSGVAECR